MRLAPIRKDLVLYIKKHNLKERWKKASDFFERDVRHPSLHIELLEPKWRGIYSFRLDRKYRALFFIRPADGFAEVFAITNHYRK